ncbi:MAG: ABC transporter permease [Gemmatimonadota bacterium]|nr:ABC transporter permease [Gemmatimonadota bacterium]
MTPPRGFRLYRRLLRLLPEDMTRRFGRDMEAVLRHRLEQTRGRPGRTAVVWMHAIADVIGQAVALAFDERGEGAMRPSSIMQDVRYATRGVRRTPGLALMAILTLALGIGASTATFSIVHGVLLEKLPVHEPERVVVVWPEVNANRTMVALADEAMPSLEGVAGMSAWSLTVTGLGEPRTITGLKVSTSYFELLGVRPALGRGFLPEEDLPGAAGVVVLSHDFWMNELGGDPAAIDRTIEIGGADYDRRRVVGVMPPGVDEFMQDVDVWIPLDGDPAATLEADDTWYVNTRVARLAPDATLEQANAEVRAHASSVQRTLPGIFSADESQTATVRRVREYMTRDVRASILVALGTVGLVLLIACFNVTNLLLARGDLRARDMAVRAALGASRLRMARMLLTEAAILGVTGGLLGVGAAYGLVRVIVEQAPDNLPGIGAVSVSPVVLGFAVVATLVSTLIAGLVPALRAGRVRGTATLGGSGRGTAHRGVGRLTPALVGGQIALAVVVTIGSGLMLRSLGTLLSVDPGIDGENVMAFLPSPPANRYDDGVAFRDYYRQVFERVEALPFVESVGGIHIVPGGGNNWSFPTFPEGVELVSGDPVPSVNFRAVRGDYFGTTGMPLRRGRPIEDTDTADTEPVVVVNESFVARFWSDEDPIGKSLSIFSREGTRYRVVGVMGDVHQHGRDREPLAEMYFAHEQVPWDQMGIWVVAKVHPAERGPGSYADALREAVWSVDPNVPITGMDHLADILVESTRGTRFLALLLGAFGALALTLCAVGVFGVTAYTNGRRKAEFGVRLALGSSRGSILRSAVMRSLLPVSGGLAVGLLVAAGASRLLESALFGVTASDPATFAGVTLVMSATAVAASIVPAWRATRVDPVEVLATD